MPVCIEACNCVADTENVTADVRASDASPCGACSGTVESASDMARPVSTARLCTTPEQSVSEERRVEETCMDENGEQGETVDSNEIHDDSDTRVLARTAHQLTAEPSYTAAHQLTTEPSCTAAHQLTSEPSYTAAQSTRLTSQHSSDEDIVGKITSDFTVHTRSIV